MRDEFLQLGEGEFLCDWIKHIYATSTSHGDIYSRMHFTIGDLTVTINRIWCHERGRNEDNHAIRWDYIGTIRRYWNLSHWLRRSSNENLYWKPDNDGLQWAYHSTTSKIYLYLRKAYALVQKSIVWKRRFPNAYLKTTSTVRRVQEINLPPFLAHTLAMIINSSEIIRESNVILERVQRKL